MSNAEIIALLKRGNLTLDEVRSAVSRYEGHDFALVERQAFYAFQGMPLKVGTTPEDLDLAAKELRTIAKNPKVSEAGHASLNPGESAHDLEEANVWLLWLILREAPLEYWSLVVPATLNMIDSPKPVLKAVGAQFATILAKDHLAKLDQTGLIPVFRQGLEPLMTYVPPSTEVNQSLKILEPVIAALLGLSQTRTDQNRLILRVFGALEHAQENIEYIRTLLRCLGHIVTAMGVNAVAHLQQLVYIFKSIACNPFFDLSPALVESLGAYMRIVIAECRPRIEVYKYEIMLGAKKGNLELPMAEFFSAEEYAEIEQMEVARA